VHALAIGAREHAFVEARQHADAFAQGALEVELAPHGAFGDRGDLWLQAGEVRELVQAFDRDRGRIHVGHQKPLAAMGRRHDGNIDRLVREGLAQGRLVSGAFAGDLGRAVGRQPAWAGGNAQRIGGKCKIGRGQRADLRIGDQDEDLLHGRAALPGAGRKGNRGVHSAAASSMSFSAMSSGRVLLRPSQRRKKRWHHFSIIGS
jgi:hypothetical protein